MEVSNQNKNRIRDEYGELQVDMQNTKRVRLGLDESIVNSDLDPSDYEQIAAASNFLTFELQEVQAVRDDLLNIVDDSDTMNSSFHGLDSVIRSLEEEIHLPQPEPTVKFSGSPPDLRYLLGASDDELGIPPAVELAEEAKDEVVNLHATSSELPGEISGYDPFHTGTGGDSSWLLSYDEDDTINRDAVALDGLFDYPDDVAASELPLWTKSLSAL